MVDTIIGKRTSRWLAIVAAWWLAGCSKSKDEGEPAPAAPEERSAEVIGAAETTAEVPIGKQVDWQKEVDNPSGDGWDSEVRAAEAKAQLKKLGEILGSADGGDLTRIITGSLPDSSLRPKLERVFADDSVVVDRLDPSGSAQAATFDPETGTGFRSEFKVFQISADGADFVTQQLVSFSWRTAHDVVEQHARWSIEWSAAERPPKIRKLEVMEFEQTRTKLPGGRALFSDCTESALGANPSYREQILRGLNHWHERIPYRNSLNGLCTPGLALGDVNGDGLDDLYLCQHPGLPNRLYLQNPDGTVRDASDEWGVNWLDDSRCALIVDLDNDGDRDLAVAILGHVVLASNRDNEGFEIELVFPVMESTISLAAADYDRDGMLDLYVGGYAPDTTTADAAPTAVGFGSEQFVYHDANNSIENLLLHNETGTDGGWKFSDVTKAVGLGANNRRWTLASAWEDFDDDGDPDLYVANDFGRNNLYRNDGGRFVDVAAELGVEDSASGMSVSWGDYDGDGRMDLYVANMFSAAGNRIVPQAGFKPRITGDVRRAYQRFARGNTLLRNLGTDFADTSVAAGVTMGRWAWSSLFSDLNNDGWEDLVVANGHITAEGDSGDL